MIKKTKIFVFCALIIAIFLLFAHLIHGGSLAVLNPKGIVAQKERVLLIRAVLLMLIVVVPVFGITFSVAWKYRAGNAKAIYEPNFDNSIWLEIAWWGFPCLIILLLAGLTWKATNQLDPYRPLDSNVKPITVQVVALQWKWLFMYPEQHIASVNFLQFPENTPLNFEITADAPMNSFWIPQLGGQIYAMPGMTTQLHLMANQVGSFRGVSANLSGEGFAGMHFVAKSSSQADFDKWVTSVQSSSKLLDASEYTSLAKPSQNNAVAYYSASQEGMYDDLVMKYMTPGILAPAMNNQLMNMDHSMNMNMQSQ